MTLPLDAYRSGVLKSLWVPVGFWGARWDPSGGEQRRVRSWDTTGRHAAGSGEHSEGCDAVCFYNLPGELFFLQGLSFICMFLTSS